MVFGQSLKNYILAKQDSIEKVSSSRSERCKFELPSSFQGRVMTFERNLKPWTMVFGQNFKTSILET